METCDNCGHECHWEVELGDHCDNCGKEVNYNAI